MFIIWKITSQGFWVPKTLTLNSQPLEFQIHYEFPLSLPLDRGKCLITSLRHLCGCVPRYLYIFPLHYTQFPLVAQMLKNLPVMWDTRVLFLGWERSPGEGNRHPQPYSGEFHGLGKESQRVRHDWVTFMTLHSGHYVCFCSLCRKFILGNSLRQIKMSHKIIAIKMGLRVWHSWELTGQSNTKAFSSHSVSLILW